MVDESSELASVVNWVGMKMRIKWDMQSATSLK